MLQVNFVEFTVLLACEPAHIWEHTCERQRAKITRLRSAGFSLFSARGCSRGCAPGFSLFAARACAPKCEPARRLLFYYHSAVLTRAVSQNRRIIFLEIFTDFAFQEERVSFIGKYIKFILFYVRVPSGVFTSPTSEDFDDVIFSLSQLFLHTVSLFTKKKITRWHCLKILNFIFSP